MGTRYFRAVLDVFALGQCVVDRLAVVDRFPGPDEKAEAVELREECGGPAATAAVALARWGRRCAFAGVVGDDADGRRIRADLEAEDVEPRLAVRAGGSSQFAFVAVERATGRRRIYWRRPSGGPPRPPELAPPRARVLLTDGLWADASLAAAARADAVVVDAGTLREGTTAMIPHADVFVASESFARAYAGSPREAVERLAAEGIAVAGVTLGSRGFLASCAGTWLEHPAWPVEVVDTTGCGDVFHAGLVEGLLAGWAWPRVFHFANWAAGQAATALGTRAGIPARDRYPRGSDAD